MKKNTASAVRELIEDTVRGLGFTLWDVTYEKDGRDYTGYNPFFPQQR